MDIHWMYLFIDTPEERAAQAWGFWQQALQGHLSRPRGRRAEYATLAPASGDAWVKLQALLDGPPAAHVDFCVTDIDAAAEQACALGARELDAVGDLRVLRSPGGLSFCFVDWQATGAASHQARTGMPDTELLADQLCLDIPQAAFAFEVRFWQELTGWQLQYSSGGVFAHLVRPEHLPVRLLFHLVGDNRPRVTAHLDLASADRVWHTEAHLALGAEHLEYHDSWTVLRAPGGNLYCITDRDPATGRLAN